MAKLSAENLVQRTLELGLISDAQLRDLWAEPGSRNLSGEEFQQLLLRRGLLTNYQLDRLLAGNRHGFFYGDYKILYLVGAGTFARVFRASHVKTNELAAVKVLRRKFSEDAEQTDRFYREGQLCKTLKHPNIVPIYEVFSQADTHYLVMEFVEGRNLRDFIRVRKSLDPLDASKLILGVANGLQYAFEKGITHRDIKLSNVLVSSRGQAKLVDFGLAGADTNLSDEALAKLDNPRTIDYAGLERASGVRKDDARSDIFFVGCMYYHLLSGHPALVETKDKVQRLSKTRFLEIPPLRDIAAAVPPQIAMVVGKALDLNPAKRYQAPGEMAADLRLAIQRLQSARAAGESAIDGNGMDESEGLKEGGQPWTLMVVEADLEMQNVFRQQLKRRGYRVLVTTDPARAFGRFADDPNVADLVLFSSGSLGESALEAFNRCGALPGMKEVPAVLLLDERHKGWRVRASDIGPQRQVLVMPIKLRDLRDVLSKLLAARVV
jgi:serine/threonine-protein kinase